MFYRPKTYSQLENYIRLKYLEEVLLNWQFRDGAMQVVLPAANFDSGCRYLELSNKISNLVSKFSTLYVRNKTIFCCTVMKFDLEHFAYKLCPDKEDYYMLILKTVRDTQYKKSWIIKNGLNKITLSDLK